MKSYVLFLSALLMSTTVFAASGSLNVTINSKNVVSEFTAEGDGYYMSNIDGEGQTVVKGRGILKSMSNITGTDFAQGIPDRSQGSYSKYIIERTGEKTVTLHFEALLLTEVGEIENNHSTEYKIVKGTWADYEDGKEITLKLTREGRKQEQANSKKIGEQLSLQTKSSLEDAGLEVKKVKVAIKESLKDKVVLSNEKLVLKKSSLKINFSLSVSY